MMTLLTKKQFWLFPACLPLAVGLGLCGDMLPVMAGNQVMAWGAGTTLNVADNNDYGQSIVPAGLTNAVLATGGWRHALALKSDGTLTGWGDDTLGQTDFPQTSNYVAIACGSLHSVALTAQGTVVAAGDDYYGQTDIPPGLSNVVAIACGFYHSLALEAGGTVVAWGASAGTRPVGDTPNYGQTLVPAGLSNVVAIAAGGYHSLALRADGTLSEWGDESVIPAGLSNMVGIATGAEHGVALKTDGTLVVWGSNEFGQASLPAGLSNVVAVAAGGWHTLALKNDGTVVAWGAGVGSNTNVDYRQNLVPAGLSNVLAIAAGEVNSLALAGSSPPSLKAPLIVAGFGTNGFTVALPTRNGRVYRLEYKNSLTNQIWSTFPLQTGIGGTLQLNDPAPFPPQRFYRVSLW